MSIKPMNIKPMRTLTVAELRKLLETYPDEAEVRIWLPGSRIALGLPMVSPVDAKQLLIEGNIEPGSALGA